MTLHPVAATATLCAQATPNHAGATLDHRQPSRRTGRGGDRKKTKEMEKQYRIQFFTHNTGEWFTHDNYYSESVALHAIRQLRVDYPQRQWRIVKVQEFVIHEGSEAQP